MGKSPANKKKLKNLTQSDLVNIYSKLADFTKEELVFIKQQLQGQQIQINGNQQQKQQQVRSKSNKKQLNNNEQIVQSYLQGQNPKNQLFIINTDKPQQQNTHHMDSVNIYLQAQKKPGKKLNKKKKNLDLADVCNESTIITKSRMQEERKQLQEDIIQTHLEIEEELKNMPESPNAIDKTMSKLHSMMTGNNDQEQSENINRMALHQKLRSSQEKLRTHLDDRENSLNRDLISQQQQIYQTNTNHLTQSGTMQMQNKTIKNKRYQSSKQQQSAVSTQRIQPQNLLKTQKPKDSMSNAPILDKNVPVRNSQSKSIDTTQNLVGVSQQLKTVKNRDQHRIIENRFEVIKEGQESQNLDRSLNFQKFNSSGQNFMYNSNKLDPVMDYVEETKFSQKEIESLQVGNGLDDTQYLLNYQPLKATIDPTDLKLNIDEPYKTIKDADNQEVLSRENSQNRDQVFETKIVLIDQSPFAQRSPQKPNSTKNKENLQFQAPAIFNPQITANNFQQVQNTTRTTKQLKAPLLTQFPAKKVKADAIICSIVSIEPYFKRTLQKLGWIEAITSQNSNVPSTFHIKFDITDKEGTQNKLKSSQWYNHFPNNRELTTKAGLCKNLWQQCSYDYELKTDRFFPRCYDLSDQKQIDLFIDDFQQTAILGIIKTYALYFLNRTKDIQKYLQQYNEKKQFAKPTVYKQQFKLRCSKIDQLLSGAGMMLGNDCLRLAIQYSKQQILRKWKLDRKAKSFHRKFSEEDLTMMVEYSQAMVANDEWMRHKFPIYEQVKTIIAHQKLEKRLFQYKTIDGTNNVWVVKPSYNARGLGVYCSNTLKEIIQQGKKSQSKIVQKYIENPFLINKKKFDIRQWAMVTSWEPLDVYIFQSAYLKMCGSDFSLNNLSDQYVHLSNFSVQKNNKTAGEYNDFVMSNDQFENYIKDLGRSEFSYKNDLYPKIEDVVYKTFKGAQDSMEQRQNTFEIYGFDLILDENLDPWVIEVNLSPACNERTEFLTKMLDDMSLEVLTFLENKIILQNTVDTEWEANFKERKEILIKKQIQQQNSLYLNEDSFYVDNDIKHRWLRVSDCLQDQKNYQISMQILNNLKINQQPLEIMPAKVDQKQERKIDLFHKKMKAVHLIQKCYRGYKGRQVYKNKVQQKASVIIQKYLRQRIAKDKVNKMIQERASIQIQKYLKQKLAKNKVKLLIAEKISNAKEFVSIKLQSHYRRRKAFCQFLKLRANFKALIIQKYL